MVKGVAKGLLGQLHHQQWTRTELAPQKRCGAIREKKKIKKDAGRNWDLNHESKLKTL